MQDAPAPGETGREERVALAALLALCVTAVAWWALALWPVTDEPAWLERTRYVCFGVRPDGLPDAGGWIALIGSPVGMLAIILVGWGDGVRALFRRARRSPALAGAAVLFAAGVVVFAGGLLRAAQARAATVPTVPAAALAADEHLRLDMEAPALALTAHDGVRRTLDELRGRPVLVTFAFGHCTTICPVVVKQVLDARTALAGTPAVPAVLIVTVDPWRDVPSRLPAIAAGWNLPPEDAWVLGGTIEEVEAALDAWNVARQRDERTGDVTHPALVYVVDPDGRIAFATTGGADTLRELIERL